MCDRPGTTLLGSARKFGDFVQLAHDGIQETASAFWFNAPVNLSNGMRTQFTVEMERWASAGAVSSHMDEGMAFVLLSAAEWEDKMDTAIGFTDEGGWMAPEEGTRGLGYAGMSHSVAVELDNSKTQWQLEREENGATWKTTYDDVDNHHVSVHARGESANSAYELMPSHGVSTPDEWGLVWPPKGKTSASGWVGRGPVTFTLDFRADNLTVTQDFEQPKAWPLRIVDAFGPDPIDGRVMVGFTSSTGKWTTAVRLLSWNLTDSGTDAVCFDGFGGPRCGVDVASAEQRGCPDASDECSCGAAEWCCGLCDGSCVLQDGSAGAPDTCAWECRLRNTGAGHAVGVFLMAVFGMAFVAALCQTSHKLIFSKYFCKDSDRVNTND